MPLYRHVLAKHPNGVFIETGTHRGGAVETALSLGFPKVISIESDPILHSHCLEKFRMDDRVSLIRADSALALGELLKGITTPATFWLDAHDEAKGTPILSELAAIGSHPLKSHTILVDDMRIFRVKLAWARRSNVSEVDVVKQVLRINPDYDVSYEDDECSERDVLVACPRAPKSDGLVTE